MQIGFLKNYNNNFKQFFVSDLVYYLSNSSDLYFFKYWKKYYILFTIMNRIHTFHIKIEKLWQYIWNILTIKCYIYYALNLFSR